MKILSCAIFSGVVAALIGPGLDYTLNPQPYGIIARGEVLATAIFATALFAWILAFLKEKDLPYGRLPILSWLVIGMIAGGVYRFVFITMLKDFVDSDLHQTARVGAAVAIGSFCGWFSLHLRELPKERSSDRPSRKKIN